MHLYILSKGGTQILTNSKRGDLNKIFGGDQKEGRISKVKGRGTQLFKSNLGIEKDKNGDF